MVCVWLNGNEVKNKSSLTQCHLTTHTPKKSSRQAWDRKNIYFPSQGWLVESNYFLAIKPPFLPGHSIGIFFMETLISGVQ